MASAGILFIFTIVCISRTAKTGFITLPCKPDQVGQYGQQSLVECVVQTALDVMIRVVSWKKEGTKKALLVFEEGEFDSLPGYSLAEQSWNNRNMNISLLISDTSVQDEGVYTCEVMTNSGISPKSRINFQVTAKYSTPTIRGNPETISQSSPGGSLTCESKDGYPKGQLRWFDEHDKDWTNSATMSAVQTPSGRFDLSSELTLLPASIFPKYTCKVFNASGGKEGGVTFEVPDVPRSDGLGAKGEGLGQVSKIVAPVVVIGSVIAGLLMALLFFRRRSQRARRPSTAPLMGEHQGVRTCESDVEEGGEMVEKCQGNVA